MHPGAFVFLTARFWNLKMFQCVWILYISIAVCRSYVSPKYKIHEFSFMAELTYVIITSTPQIFLHEFGLTLLKPTGWEQIKR